MNRILLTLGLAALALPGTARACGGFFCNNSAPVVQNAERIVFGVDADAGTVDAHVQITYSGPAEEFAWVVPVQTEPDLFLSTQVLFDTLSLTMAPRFSTQSTDLGDCNRWFGDTGLDGDVDTDTDADADADADADTDTGVVIISEERVGPYDTVVLQASSDTVLIEWLQDHQYDIPSTMGPALAPYIASGHYVIALRLTKGNDLGDLSPIGFTYPGTTPGIPIQLTSVAASPDMRLETYVFGDERYVPLNYLHVQINPMKIAWRSGGFNYYDVITLAADEAGGHAFATDSAGDPMGGMLYQDGWYDLTPIHSVTSPTDAVEAIASLGFPPNNPLLDVMTEHIPVPAEVQAQNFFNCPSCYDDTGLVVDGNALADDLQEFVVEPLIKAEQLFAHNKVSRMSSSISPVEMTVDPMFVANPDMPDVAALRTAELTYDCRQIHDSWTAPRSFEAPGLPEILVPSERWLDDNDMTLDDFLSGITDINALVIEETSAVGAPRPIADHTELVSSQVDNSNNELPGIPGNGWQGSGSGCGCTSSRGAAGFGLLLPLLVVARRRRVRE